MAARATTFGTLDRTAASSTQTTHNPRAAKTIVTITAILPAMGRNGGGNVGHHSSDSEATLAAMRAEMQDCAKTTCGDGNAKVCGGPAGAHGCCQYAVAVCQRKVCEKYNPPCDPGQYSDKITTGQTVCPDQEPCGTCTPPKDGCTGGLRVRASRASGPSGAFAGLGTSRLA